MDLFTHAVQSSALPTTRMQSEAPLAARYAPRSAGTRRTLDEYISLAQRSCAEHHPRAGQAAMRSIALRRAIEADRMFPSILLWGPPGTGKTTLAIAMHSIAGHRQHHQVRAMRSIGHHPLGSHGHEYMLRQGRPARACTHAGD